jgi:hypothetical protein
VKPVDPDNRYGHENEVVDMDERVPSELHGCSQDKPNGRCRHAAKHRSNDRPITPYVVSQAYGIHEQRSWQAHTAYRGDGSSKAVQPVSHQDRHIGGV